jgi:hypothetical protein
MTDAPVPAGPEQPGHEEQVPDEHGEVTSGQAQQVEQPVAQPAEAVPAPEVAATGVPATAPVGKVRETGTCILLMIVTLGFYSWYWYYSTHEEMKRHSGEGIGGPIALLLAILLSVVMPFFSSHEVGRLYERRGQKPPVTVLTGLWFLLLGWFFFVGAIVWFVRTNAALNDYWRSVEAR